MEQAALILEGGGMRGVYTAGVLDYFLDRDISFPKVYGVSAGACHACSYLSRQRGRAVRTVVDFIRDPRYAGLRSLLKTGNFFGVDMIYHEIPDRLIPYDYEAFMASPSALCAVVTNCLTGGAEYRLIQDMRRDINWIQASSSLPLLSRMVVLEGIPYLDGGVSDSIPLGKSIGDGNGRNLVILTQHRGYQKEPNSMMAAIRLRYRSYPELVASVAGRHLQYNASLELIYREEEAGRALVIQPEKPVEIGRLEKNGDKLRLLYRQGYEDAAARAEQIDAFLHPAPKAVRGA